MKCVFCDCSYNQLFKDDIKQKILTFIKQHFSEIFIAKDLCALFADKTEFLSNPADEELLIFACYPRTVKSLFNAANIPFIQKKHKVFNMRELSFDEIKNGLTPYLQNNPAQEENTYSAKSEKISWFPVIDKERCTACGQCFEYCLFGTYTMEKNQQPLVSFPYNCKPNCPACARICPEAAIIFPKIEDYPINGSEIENEDEVRLLAKQNLKIFSRDNLQSVLSKRQRPSKMPLFKEKD